MKKTFLVFTAAVILLGSCTDKKKASSGNNSFTGETTNTSSGSNDEEKAGNFTFNGTSFKGISSTQYFGDKITGQFSVLCQQDEPLALLQAVFANEKDALSGVPLKPAESFYSLEAGEVHVALSGKAIGDNEFITSSSSSGSISISDKTLIIKDLKLYNGDHQEKVVNANISF